MIFLFVLTACVDHQFSNRDQGTALLRACSACDKSKSEMDWFATVLSEADSKPEQQGSIYVASIDEQIYFIHQPVIMSCLACVVYDCAGNRVQADPQFIEKMLPFLTPEHRLFSSFPD